MNIRDLRLLVPSAAERTLPPMQGILIERRPAVPKLMLPEGSVPVHGTGEVCMLLSVHRADLAQRFETPGPGDADTKDSNTGTFQS